MENLPKTSTSPCGPVQKHLGISILLFTQFSGWEKTQRLRHLPLKASRERLGGQDLQKRGFLSGNSYSIESGQVFSDGHQLHCWGQSSNPTSSPPVARHGFGRMVTRLGVKTGYGGTRCPCFFYHHYGQNPQNILASMVWCFHFFAKSPCKGSRLPS